MKQTKFVRYEQEKKALQGKALSPKEYERELRRIAARLGV